MSNTTLRSDRTSVTTRTFWRVPSASRTALAIAIAALLLKLPQALASLVVPEGVPGLIPPTQGLTSVVVATAWLAFSAALLMLRSWLGVVSALWFLGVSAVSSLQVFGEGFPIWGTWQAGTALAGIVATITAITFGAFRKTKPADPSAPHERNENS